MSRRNLAIALAMCVSALGGVVISHAGPLDPPAGPVASTHKTLTEVEPRTAINVANTPGDSDSLYRITKPGSYYLTGNINGVAGRHGIEVVASGVTIDLNGFALQGAAGMGSFSGICSSVSSLSNVAVLNGTIQNWGAAGIDLGVFSVDSVRVEGVVLAKNATYGLYAGDNCVVSNCCVRENGSSGLVLQLGSVVRSTTCMRNGSAGIYLQGGAVVESCSSYDNQGSGINVGPSSSVVGCVAYSNTGTGILGADCVSVINCSSRGNQREGIALGTGANVRACTVQSNNADGILCGAASLIRDNASSYHDGTATTANIRVTGAQVRVEGNNCSHGSFGIRVTAAGNIIVRNTCAENTSNWHIVAGNAFGPIVSANLNVSTFSGSGSAGSTLTSSDSNANFNY